MSHALTPEQRDRLERVADTDVVAVLFALDEANEKVAAAEKQVAALRAALVAFDVGTLPEMRDAIERAAPVVADTAAVAARYVDVDSDEGYSLLEDAVHAGMSYDRGDRNVPEHVAAVIAAFKAERAR